MTIKNSNKKFGFFMNGVCLSWFFIVLLFTFQTSKASANSQIPGEECQPANINQALTLGLGWSQFGVANNSPLGASSFYIVCPVYGHGDLTVSSRFNATDALDITCILFKINGSAFVEASSFSISNPVNADSASTTHPLPTTINYRTESISLVCALPPQTTISRLISTY